MLFDSDEIELICKMYADHDYDYEYYNNDNKLLLLIIYAITLESKVVYHSLHAIMI